jgi:hypothetical protein
VNFLRYDLFTKIKNIKDDVKVVLSPRRRRGDKTKKLSLLFSATAALLPAEWNLK